MAKFNLHVAAVAVAASVNACLNQFGNAPSFQDLEVLRSKVAGILECFDTVVSSSRMSPPDLHFYKQFKLMMAEKFSSAYDQSLTVRDVASFSNSYPGR